MDDNTTGRSAITIGIDWELTNNDWDMACKVYSIVYQESILVLHMGVSINGGSPKWLVYKGTSIYL